MYNIGSHLLPRKNKPRPLSELFPEEWIQGFRKALADLDNNDLNKPHGTYSTVARMLVAYKCLASVAIVYAPPKMHNRIMLRAETICNRVSASLIEDRDQVSKCLTKKHSECTDSYVSVIFNRTVICKCRCHKKTVFD